MNNYELVLKELKFHGVEILDDEYCSFEENGKKYKSKILTKVNYLKKNYKNNLNFFNELLLDLSSVGCKCVNEMEVIDSNTIKLFIESLQESYKLSQLSFSNTNSYEFIIKNDILRKIRSLLDRDYKSFNKEDIFKTISLKISLDYIFRRNEKIAYISSLLRLVRRGQNKINSLPIKEAKGFQGPWGNLDLPMKERAFEWDDIAEEVSGRQRDKRNQRRYTGWLETYNRTNKFGEGFFFTEWRNQPYSWENRFTDSPYPQLSSGTWR